MTSTGRGRVKVNNPIKNGPRRRGTVR
ncbi:protein of unknown function [Azospirillum baldaniorum]|uniref:Uncharacterized protein n=1 Tax=Azospirillum baldaniorum TaxID=1064539 RepID=A0A9P1JP50_9PROT|nr:protein of unknown function [Azospirillum baldaniorum]